MASPVLTWSSQFSVIPPSSTPASLVGDKILLPQSALEQLLAAVSSVPSPTRSTIETTVTTMQVDVSWASAVQTKRAQPQLPHPLMFRLYNSANNRFSYAAPLEFSAEEGKIGVSPLLRDALGIEEEEGEGEGGGGGGDMQITVVWKDLPKGTYVRLRPLEAGYDEEDWKALLERYLRVNFTTLTVGEILPVGGRTLAISGKKGTADFRFLIDKMEPEDAVCIVDTDLEVDIEPLSEEQARETLKQKLARKSGGALKIDEPAKGAVLPGEYHFYELSEWVRGEPLLIELDEIEDGDEVDIFVSTSNQHHKPRQDEHIWGDFGSKYPKHIQIDPTNIELADAGKLFIGLHGYRPIDLTEEADSEEDKSPRQYSLCISQSELLGTDMPLDTTTPPGPDHKQCKNCTQWVPMRTFILHESFCFRNNIVCPLCKHVSKRGTENAHWHCQHCTTTGTTGPASHQKHTAIYHTPRTCPFCTHYAAVNLLDLAVHRTTTCPEKLIICRFCHLLVPQEGDGDGSIPSAQVLLSSLTPHELTCGSRTTECTLCARIVRMRDLPAHVKHHDLQRLSRAPPHACRNSNCARTTGSLRHPNPFGLCATCFGPLYAPGYDPGDVALTRRVERRLLRQRMSGCGRGWCRNGMCQTGRGNVGIVEEDGGREVGTVAQALGVVRPIVEGRGVLGLCVDEVTQGRRVLADRVAAESVLEEGGGWDVEWVVAAVEAVGADEGAVRKWLERNAVRRGECMC